MAEALATYLVQYVGSEIVASVIAYAVVITASVVVSKALASQTMGGSFGSDVPNPGNRQQIPPAGDNKLPVVYGSAWVGGIVTDLSISADNQQLYFVLALSEVTNTESGGTPDSITFGDIYYGGKKVTFQSDGYTVASLYDESTGVTDSTVDGKIQIFLYSNGSNNPANSSQNAISVMQTAGLSYTWDTTKLMSNCAFAIVHLTYSQTASVTSLQQTKFKVINSRTSTGDCISDYLLSSRYGAGIPASQIDNASLSALNAYSNQIINYTNYSGGTSTLARFKFDGVVDTTLTVMQNLQLMATSCDCLIKYNEITAQWGVVVQTATAVPVMDLNDSNMVSSITVTPMDISNTYNVIECKYPDGSAKDSFSSVTYDLAQLYPSLLFANEPINKQSLSLYFVNNDVRVQLLANRFLKAAREDLQIQCKINYSGIQLEAGDVVTVTNANYGWTAKPFRVIKVTEEYLGDGMVNASLNLTEYNSTVYDDVSITQFTPAPNTGIGDPTFFGNVPAPTISNPQPTVTNPSFDVLATSSSSGITQYAEIWYSAYSNPTSSQRIFAGTTAVQSNGNPYGTSTALPTVTLTNVPAGNWYFFSRMVNSLGYSTFSPASSVFAWKPSTFQYSERYLNVAYGTSATGAGFSLNPRGKTYYGLQNSSAITGSTTPADYTWYPTSPNFGTNVYLVYSNRTGYKFSFATGFADVASASGGRFVPTETAKFDLSLWSALPDGTNYIDLTIRTGQLTQIGTSAGSPDTGLISVVNGSDGTVVAALNTLLDLGGAPTVTASAALITVDQFGRVRGFVAPDNFYYSKQLFTATSGQTVFTPTARASGYITGQDLVYQNGVLLDTTEYTETSTAVTLNTGAATGDVVTIISMRCVSSGIYYEPLNITVASVSSPSVTYSTATSPQQTISAGDLITFSNTGTPTTYTVSSVNTTTRVITFTGAVTATAGQTMYRYRAAGSSYPAFSRYTATMTNTTSFTPTTWNFDSGYELPFLNGTILTDYDYDLAGNLFTLLPSIGSGNLTIIQMNQSNQTTPIGNMQNIFASLVVGQTVYPLTYDSNAFNLYDNGVLLAQGTDYTTATGSFAVANTPTTTDSMVEQLFARQGAA